MSCVAPSFLLVLICLNKIQAESFVGSAHGSWCLHSAADTPAMSLDFASKAIGSL